MKRSEYFEEFERRWNDPVFQSERNRLSRERKANMLAARKQNGGMCVYCGNPAQCADHVIPESRGGSSKPENLVPACFRCNRSKKSRTPEEWRAGKTYRRGNWITDGGLP